MGDAADLIRCYLAALSAADAEAAAALVAEDFVNEHVSVRGDSLVGRAAYRARLEGFLASMPGLSYEIERLVAMGDDVVVAYRMSAGWRPDQGGEPRPFSIRGVFWFVVRDATIARRVDYRDGVDFEQQVGLR